MLNIIKMDIYRMIKAKSTWIILLVSAFFLAITIYGVSYSISYYNEHPDEVSGDMQTVESVDNDSFGVSVEEDVFFGIDGEVSASDLFYANVQSRLFLIFVAIFAVLFVNNEQRTGYIKNIVGQLSNRGLLVLSKIVSCLIFCILLFIIPFIFNMLFSQIFLGYVNLSGFVDALPIFGLQLILHFAFAAFVVFVTVLFKSAVASMAIGTMAPLGITSMICSFINMLLQKLNVDESFSLFNYTLSGNVQQLAFDSSSGDIVRAVIVGAGFLILSTVFAMFVFKKRDIK